jgi:hypothetical protein
MAEQRKNRVSESRQNREEKCNVINGVCGRGSWIRTNDLQYPKQWKTLPRVDRERQAAPPPLVGR